MNGIFSDLENEDKFVEFICARFQETPENISAVMSAEQVPDLERARYSYIQYMQNLDRFSVYLNSSNPDQFKRSGALLHSLYQSDIITSLKLESSSEELEAGYTRVNVGDASHILKWVEFYEIYHNQFRSFDMAFRCCASYQDNLGSYDFEYLHNVCRYLNVNNNLSLDSLFMLFKSLFTSTA